ncbi:hypothetical protein QBC47DRAFT_213325 [Echria macrotheca]|uniref:Uncharacterized protein n=1 Tax=Echria macrotheca TaxID=438768 RepID=A0AAJ0BDV3_9PEZI|nr:hypothetical protein QBC47DRAFT_213325 [Echria macrotheca]
MVVWCEVVSWLSAPSGLPRAPHQGRPTPRWLPRFPLALPGRPITGGRHPMNRSAAPESRCESAGMRQSLLFLHLPRISNVVGRCSGSSHHGPNIWRVLRTGPPASASAALSADSGGFEAGLSFACLCFLPIATPRAPTVLRQATALSPGQNPIKRRLPRRLFDHLPLWNKLCTGRRQRELKLSSSSGRSRAQRKKHIRPLSTRSSYMSFSSPSTLFSAVSLSTRKPQVSLAFILTQSCWKTPHP